VTEVKVSRPVDQISLRRPFERRELEWRSITTKTASTKESELDVIRQYTLK